MSIGDEATIPGLRNTKHHIAALLPALRATGTFKPATLFHVTWCGAVLGLLGLCYEVLLHHPGNLLRAVCIVGCAMLLVQTGLVSHEAGHGAITRDTRLKKLIGYIGDSFLTGYASSYGQHRHHLHHKYPNRDGVDPDLESGLYVLYEAAARDARGIRCVIASLQPWSLFLGLPFWVFSLRVEGACHVAANLRRGSAIDAVCLLGHVACWLVIPGFVLGPIPTIVNYVATTMVGGLYMGAILVLPHVGLGTQPQGMNDDSFMERQLRFSRNFARSWIGTLLCGGLNLQIEHHLFPHVPYIRLRRARSIIATYCRDHHLPYRQMGYGEAWLEVMVHLKRMSRLVQTKPLPQSDVSVQQRLPL